MTWTQSSPKKSTALYHRNKSRFDDLLKCYDRIVSVVSKTNNADILPMLSKRAARWNPSNFLTGNALIHNVDHILEQYSKMEREDIVQLSVEKIIHYVSGELASLSKKSLYDVNSKSIKGTLHQKLWDQILMNLHEYRDEF